MENRLEIVCELADDAGLLLRRETRGAQEPLWRGGVRSAAPCDDPPLPLMMATDDSSLMVAALRRGELLEALADALIFVGTDGEVREVRTSAPGLLWLGPERLGQPLDHTFAAEAAAVLGAACERANSSRHAETVECDQPFAAGVAHLEVRVTPITGGVVLVCREVSPRRHADAGLLRRLEILGVSQAVGHVGSWDWDVRRGELWWSDEMCRLHGRDPAQFKPTLDAALSCYHPEERVRISEGIESSLAGAAGPPGEYRVLGPHGERIHWVSWKTFFDDAGQPIRMTGVNLDITEHRRITDTLREQTRLLDEAQRLAAIGSWEIDLLESRVRWSDETHRIHGRDPALFTPSRATLDALFHPSDRGAFNDWLDGVQQELGPKNIELRAVHPSGVVRRVRLRCEVRRGRDDAPRWLLGTTQDVTAQWQHEAALHALSVPLARLTQGQYFEQMVLELAAILGAKVCFVARLLPGDPARARTIGLAVDGKPVPAIEYPLAGTPCASLADGTPGDAVVFPSAVRGDFPWIVDRWAFEAEGYGAVLLCDVNGHPMGHLGVLTEVPIADPAQLRSVLAVFALRTAAELERHLLAEELQESHASVVAREEAFRRTSESRLAALVKRAPAVLFTRAASPPYGATYVSPNVLDLMGYPPESFTRDAAFWPEHIHPDDRARVLAAYPFQFSEGQFVHEYRFKHADGHYRWMRGDLRLVEASLGEAPQIVGFWSDVTERKDLEQQLAASASAANEANRLKSVFLANMSHELRTPLNAVLGLADALVMGTYGALSSPQAERVRIIGDSGRHLLRLINDVLDLSRVETNSLPIVIRQFDLSSLIDECAAYVALMLGQKQQRLIRNVAPATVVVRADPGRLKQVLINLLTNASKHSPALATIELGVRFVSQSLELRVSDDGPGIPLDERQRIFEPFVVLAKGEEQASASIGIGLSLVRRLTELHGGTISVEDTPGGGATFIVTLPQAPTLDETH